MRNLKDRKSLHSYFTDAHTYHLPMNVIFFTVCKEEIVFILQVGSFQLGSTDSIEKHQLPYTQSRNSFKGYKLLSTLFNKPTVYIALYTETSLPQRNYMPARKKNN